jgi:hypothetical protein
MLSVTSFGRFRLSSISNLNPKKFSPYNEDVDPIENLVLVNSVE